MTALLPPALLLPGTRLMQIIEPHLQATPVIATTRTDGEEMSASDSETGSDREKRNGRGKKSFQFSLVLKFTLLTIFSHKTTHLPFRGHTFKLGRTGTVR